MQPDTLGLHTWDAASGIEVFLLPSRRLEAAACCEPVEPLPVLLPGAVTRKNGQWNYYKLAAAESTFHKHLLGCLKGCFHDVPELGLDSKKSAKLRKSGGCCPS
jgi:hypothetical protein